MKKIDIGIIVLLAGIIPLMFSEASIRLAEGASAATSSSTDILASSSAAGGNSDAVGSASSSGKKTGSAAGTVAFCIDDAGIDFAVNGACTMSDMK